MNEEPFFLVFLALGAQLLFDFSLKNIQIEKAKKTYLSFLFQVLSWYYVIQFSEYLQSHNSPEQASSEFFSSFQDRLYLLLACVLISLVLALRNRRFSLLDFSSKEELDRIEQEEREKFLKKQALLKENRLAYIKQLIKEMYSPTEYSSAKLRIICIAFVLILMLYIFFF